MVPDRKMATMNHTRKGGGPRSVAGKAIASRNALRHGFAARLHPRSPSPERIERLARAIAGTETEPAIVAQAFKIAENELMLSEIAMHKVWVVGRLHERYAVPFAEKDNSLHLGEARIIQAWLVERAIQLQLPTVLRKYEARFFVYELSKPHADNAIWFESNPSLCAVFPDKAFRAVFLKSVMARMTAEMTERFKGSDWRIGSDAIVPIRLLALLEEPEEADGSTKNRIENKI